MIYLPKDTRPYVRFFAKIFGSKETKKIKRALNLVLTKEFSSLKELIEELGIIIDEVDSFEQGIQKEISFAVPFDDTKETLKELTKRGNRLCIISNLATPYKDPIWNLGLNKYFEKIICSCEAGVVKPGYKIYLLACQTMNVKPKNALMVGDSIWSDYRGAINAGLSAILLDRRGKAMEFKI